MICAHFTSGRHGTGHHYRHIFAYSGPSDDVACAEIDGWLFQNLTACTKQHRWKETFWNLARAISWHLPCSAERIIPQYYTVISCLHRFSLSPPHMLHVKISQMAARSDITALVLGQLTCRRILIGHAKARSSRTADLIFSQSLYTWPTQDLTVRALGTLVLESGSMANEGLYSAHERKGPQNLKQYITKSIHYPFNKYLGCLLVG